MRFRLSDVTVHWSGVDDTTPAGHSLVHGTDPLGRQNLFLFAGDTPSDEAYRGRVQMPAISESFWGNTAYGPRGTYVGSGKPAEELLARLANTTEETPR